jgi:hypothetical protein
MPIVQWDLAVSIDLNGRAQWTVADIGSVSIVGTRKQIARDITGGNMTKIIVSFFLLNVMLFSMLVFQLRQDVSVSYRLGYMQGRESVYQEQAKSSEDGNCFSKGGCQ